MGKLLIIITNKNFEAKVNLDGGSRVLNLYLKKQIGVLSLEDGILFNKCALVLLKSCWNVLMS